MRIFAWIMFAWCALMVVVIVANVVPIVNKAHADTVEYHRLDGEVYGSDGSRTHRFGDTDYTEWPDGHRQACREVDGHTLRCTNE